MLAQRMGLLLLVDEKPAKRTADSLGVRNIGTVGVILRAVELDLLGKDDAKQVVKKLVEGNFYLRPSLLMDILGRLK